VRERVYILKSDLRRSAGCVLCIRDMHSNTCNSTHMFECCAYADIRIHPLRLHPHPRTQTHTRIQTSLDGVSYCCRCVRLASGGQSRRLCPLSADPPQSAPVTSDYLISLPTYSAVTRSYTVEQNQTLHVKVSIPESLERDTYLFLRLTWQVPTSFAPAQSANSTMLPSTTPLPQNSTAFRRAAEPRDSSDSSSSSSIEVQVIFSPPAVDTLKSTYFRDFPFV